MLQTVDVGPQALERYRGVAPDATLEELRARAEELRGARVLHLNATPFGGGVSELLRSAVPLLNDLGIVADWKVIAGDEPFFEVTKTIHNGLQGGERVLSAAQRQTYLETSEENAAALEESYDYVFVHDPQPAAILPLHGGDSAGWVWRCHIDTSEPNPEVWGFLSGFLDDYDAAIFTMPEFVPPEFPIDRVDVVPPAIDPLSPKNLPLPDKVARQVLEWIGVEVDLPLITQISRFDPWKDPLGVIAAYRLTREHVPDLQLALAGSMALDSRPELPAHLCEGRRSALGIRDAASTIGGRSRRLEALFRSRGGNGLDRLVPIGEDLESHDPALAQLEDVRSLLVNLDAAGLGPAVVAREHEHVIARIEILVRLDAPMLPRAEPAAQPWIRIPAVLEDAREPRELIGPTPLHVRVVDAEAQTPVAAAPVLVYRPDQVDVALRHGNRV